MPPITLLRLAPLHDQHDRLVVCGLKLSFATLELEARERLVRPWVERIRYGVAF